MQEVSLTEEERTIEMLHSKFGRIRAVTKVIEKCLDKVLQKRLVIDISALYRPNAASLLKDITDSKKWYEIYSFMEKANYI